MDSFPLKLPIETPILTTAVSRTAGLLGVLLGTTIFLTGCGKSDRSVGDAADRLVRKPEISAEIPENLIPMVESLYAEAAADRAFAASRLKLLAAEAGPAVPYLIDRLSDPNWQVRRSAAEALGTAGDKKAVTPLIDLLGNRDGDWSVRAAAAWSLGQLGDARAVEPLAAVLNDMNAHVRYAAVGSLGQIGTPETAEPLANAARRDSDAAVRFSAIEALRTRK